MMIAALLVLALQEPPKALDDRLVVELVAAEPDLVTPTSLDVDAQGRVWVIESNTHFPPKNYKGHPSDRIRWQRARNTATTISAAISSLAGNQLPAPLPLAP